MLKRSIRWLEASLIPTSVLGGGILLLISAVYNAITGDEMRDILEEGGKLYTQLKIDDINNLGAVKIRLRSLMAAVEARKP